MFEFFSYQDLYDDDDDDDWIFDPAIDTILNSHKRTRDEAFSDDDDDDNVSSYWDWLPPEIQVHITSLAWRQHMRDMRSNQPFFNFLLREIHDYHTLTIAINEGLDEHLRGRIIYRYSSQRVTPGRRFIGPFKLNHGIVCPTIDICASHEQEGRYGCSHVLAAMYFVTKCGRKWFLGSNFHHVHKTLKISKSRIARHRCTPTVIYLS